MQHMLHIYLILIYLMQHSMLYGICARALLEAEEIRKTPAKAGVSCH